MQGIGSMAALSSTDPLSSMRFHLQPRKSLPVSDRNASVFIVRSDGRFPGGVNLRRYSVKKLVPNAVAAPADGPASAKPGLRQMRWEILPTTEHNFMLLYVPSRKRRPLRNGKFIAWSQ